MKEWIEFYFIIYYHSSEQIHGKWNECILIYENKCIQSIESKEVSNMPDNKNTQYFKVSSEPDISVKDILSAVYIALTEKGYNPVSQIIGYIMSGDPTYVTSYKNARYLIMKVDRDELLEELLQNYIDVNLK